MEKFFFLIAFLVSSCNAEQRKLPVELVHSAAASNGTCPSSKMLAQSRNDAKVKIRSILSGAVEPDLDFRSFCPCGGTGRWRRIAHLNMSDPNQECPLHWNLITSPVRACGRSTSVKTCESAIYHSDNQNYSRVCGRVTAYQKGSTDGFQRYRYVESDYLDGVSLTHGPQGSRRHVWSFVATLHETDPNYNTRYACPCTNTDVIWPLPYNSLLPEFMGSDYFCDTGNPGPGYSNDTVYTDDPLWDGEGCGPTNACCQFNNPPWFCTTLPEPTSDHLELRICTDEEEDIYVTQVNIFVL